MREVASYLLAAEAHRTRFDPTSGDPGRDSCHEPGHWGRRAPEDDGGAGSGDDRAR